ncbi:nucleotide-binding protein [Bradyrhizobium sp. 83002]|uniref:TIR domain-containing protein n=1 Tax=Bradyrhizobium aeschynomenes TaxID=2734909 RepID=UPI001556CDA2|nr:nucleotide-binding protein [Bradyrhizobium aeschynomenes]NPU10924.1 nucleotide-binding protein [Bradyrhizobium aeschynomenes]
MSGFRINPSDLAKAIERAKAAQDDVEIQWISAAAAINLLKPIYRSSARMAQCAICEHANGELVRARARRYMIGNGARDDFPIPNVFWWADGREAMTQDWQAGSFSTWINDTEHRAFQVKFAQEDIEKMMPADAHIHTMSFKQPPSNKVFLVHGRDEASKNEVHLFLKAIDLDPIILHLRPNKGRSLLTKFKEESGGADFAVVLMTPDDEGGIAGSGASQRRARQNVVFELGYFIGKLGPTHVAALVKGEIEKPSDFDGIAYIPYDSNWKTTLARELLAAKIPFDPAKVLTA